MTFTGFEWVRLVAAGLYAASFLIVSFLLWTYRNPDDSWQRSGRYVICSILVLIALIGVHLVERQNEHVPVGAFTIMSIVAALMLLRGCGGMIRRAMMFRREGRWTRR